MNQFNAYLFDIGNVILQFDFNLAAEKLRSFGIPFDDPITHISVIKDQYESGELSDDDFIRQAIDQLNFPGSTNEFATAWQHIFTLNTPMVESIFSLAATGTPLYLLSNTNGLHTEHFLRDFPVFSHFKDGVYSHEAKSMKPDIPIYQQAIDRFNLIPAETLYIDDLPANIETGKSLGFVSHQYDLNNHAAFVDLIS